MRADIEELFQAKKLKEKRIRRRALIWFSLLLVIAVVLILSSFLVVPENMRRHTLFAGGVSLSFACTFGMVCVHPLGPEDRAFCEIYNAIKLFEKSKREIYGVNSKLKEIVSEETINYLKKAHKLLKRVQLVSTGFYREMNNEVKRLKEIIKGTIAAAYVGELELTDLQEIASIFINPTLENVRSINNRLWDKYREKEYEEHGLKYVISKFYATTPGKIIMSLVFGYGLIVAISVIYCLVVGINFGTFCKGNPSIIIMGGAILSGISFFGKR